MCHFITCTLPAGADVAVAASIAAGYGRAWQPLDNPSVRASLDADETQFLTTRGHCDCGTPLGAARRGGARSLEALVDERHLARLRKRGWSAAKIERWTGDRRKAEAKRRRARESDDDATSLESWARLLRDLAGSPGVGSVGLLLHAYAGDLADETVAIRRVETIRAAELEPGVLANVEEDVLYRVRSA
jgi:hypothetical protein